MTFSQAPAMTITKGDAIVIPFSAGSFSITGSNAIICRPPLAELARDAE
jgi:mannose-6-phosphate isomerase